MTFYSNLFYSILFSLFIFLCVSQPVKAQYYPRGTNINDGYLPNLDHPDKWVLSLDGMYDWQKEEFQNAQLSYQVTHANLNLFYGGQVFRGGLQVIHDFARDVKDLSIGLGLTYNRPLFVELGVGYLNRVLDTTSFDGTSYNAKVGYYMNWIMYVKYRLRLRFSIMVNYKKINSGTDHNVLNFYPLLGIEFET